MKHTQEVRVYYHDTDSYGVVWHGSYVRWLEEGRVELCDMLGLKLEDMQRDGVTLPVVDMHIRYKSSARMNDRLLVETFISDLKPMSVTFSHVIKNAQTQKVNILAETTIVSIDKNGKLIRKFPDNLYSAFSSALQKGKTALV